MEDVDVMSSDISAQISFFDGNLEIAFVMVNILAGGSGDVSFEMHESEESLHKAKNREKWEKVIIAHY